MSQDTPPRADRPRLFDPAEHGLAAAWLAFLMVLGAITEGIGIVLLVPLLTILGDGASDGGRIGAALVQLGLPMRLDAMLALFVALVIVRGLITYYRALVAMRFEMALIDRLRTRGWRSLLHCDWRVLLGMRRSNAASLLISQVDQAGLFINQAILALATLVTLGGIGLAALAISPQLTIGALIAGTAVLLAFHGMRRRAGQLGEALGAAYGRIYSQLNEGLGALRVIKSLGREDRATTDLADQFVDLRRAQLDYQRDLGRGQLALQGGGAVVLALLVWAALERWHADVTVVLPMVALFARALPLLGLLQQAGLTCAHARPAVTAALDLIATAEAAREPEADPAAAPALAQAIQLDNVTVRFGPDGPPALDGVSAAIPARGVVALTGPSGAGKSTLADLLGGLLSPDSGTVLVDDTALSGTARRAWRGKVAYVQQDPVLISGTIRDNLRWAAAEAEDARLEQALRDASAAFVLDLPQGLDTVIGDGGRALSGGERQRLMLARALLRDPALLILDEATSALDAANEAQIAAAVRGLRGRMAVVIIGHRGALLDLADAEIRLESGHIVAPLPR